MQVDVSRTDNYYQIRIPIKDSYNDKNIRKFLDYLKIKKNAAKSRATDKDIEALSEEINAKWWETNKDNFMK